MRTRDGGSIRRGDIILRVYGADLLLLLFDDEDEEGEEVELTFLELNSPEFGLTRM